MAKKKKADRARKTTPKAKSGKPAAKKAKAAKASKPGKSAKKPKAAAAKAGHDFAESVRGIVEDAGTPLTLDRLHAEHEARYEVRSRPDVKKAVISLLESNELGVASPTDEGGGGDDAEAAILAALCLPVPPLQPLDEGQIVWKIHNVLQQPNITPFAIHIALGEMSPPNGNKIQNSNGKYSRKCPS